ncbi:hypothetical protein MTP04_30090 [Lysinibacillus sp. PLM2]|nr:hypothetical protein MTP04_30090 [Lysinibacillus sp. PLM2]
MKLTEGHIHVSMRRFLKNNDWKLIAGEYPGGSDDELYALNVVNPKVARDNSPDPRRHSKDEMIPDLIAYKDGILLIIEAKPGYSDDDRDKLIDLLTTRLDDFYSALEIFIAERNITGLPSLSSLKLAPCLAFSATTRKFLHDEGFYHIRVKDLNEATLEGPF